LKSTVIESPLISRITPGISLPSIAVKSIMAPISGSPASMNSRREKYWIRSGVGTPNAASGSREKAFFSPGIMTQTLIALGDTVKKPAQCRFFSQT
jgi:hypothetical protein